mmetsp:Transcript_18712/g.22337  ORF Transcript_18712/g.22337 Transcript_18712/m.22337 type:complete len:80 (-) Transcript_18712:224-463(-)
MWTNTHYKRTLISHLPPQRLDSTSVVLPSSRPPILSTFAPTIQTSTTGEDLDVSGIEDHMIKFLCKLGWTNSNILILKY